MAPLKLLTTTTFRWALGYLALFALATAMIVVTLLWRTNDLLIGQALQVIAAEARGLREHYRGGGLPSLVQTVSERGRLRDGGLYLLADGAGVRLAGNLPDVPREIRQRPNGGSFHYDRPSESGERESRLAVGIVIPVADQAQLVVARDIEETRALAQAIRGAFLIGMGAISLLALSGAALYSRRLLRRVDEMTAASQKIMAGDLAQRLPLGRGDDEMDRLAASLNLMLARIEQLMTGLREVSDNIAHDLKTPLTRLRNRAEAALRDPRGGPAYVDGLEHTIEEADDLIKTFNALLSIARLEAGSGADQAQMVDLVELVRDAVELYEPAADEAGLKIIFEPACASIGPTGAGVAARADRQLIGQTLANLIENAMKYGCDPARRAVASAPGADILVAVRARPGWADISVSDHGPGIAAADRERVLERFVRLDASRTRPGTGLGLSLVAAVARRHNGSVRLEDNAPGLRVILSLPTLPARPTMDTV